MQMLDISVLYTDEEKEAFKEEYAAGIFWKTRNMNCMIWKENGMAISREIIRISSFKNHGISAPFTAIIQRSVRIQSK